MFVNHNTKIAEKEFLFATIFCNFFFNNLNNVTRHALTLLHSLDFNDSFSFREKAHNHKFLLNIKYLYRLNSITCYIDRHASRYRYMLVVSISTADRSRN